jgi:putative sigma-54 modulation protein
MKNTLPPIQLTGHNTEITDVLRKFVDDKFNNHVAKHAERITSVHVVLDANKLRQLFKVTAKIHIPGADVFAESESHDMYEAIDLLIAKLIRQLEHKKD